MNEVWIWRRTISVAPAIDCQRRLSGNSLRGPERQRAAISATMMRFFRSMRGMTGTRSVNAHTRSRRFSRTSGASSTCSATCGSGPSTADSPTQQADVSSKTSRTAPYGCLTKLPEPVAAVRSPMNGSRFVRHIEGTSHISRTRLATMSGSAWLGRYRSAHEQRAAAGAPFLTASVLRHSNDR